MSILMDPKQKYHKKRCIDLIGRKYNKLQCERLMNKHKSIELVLYINQDDSIDNRFGRKNKYEGFCHGYNKYWRLHLINKNEEIIKDSFKDNIPLCNEVYSYQKSSSFYINKSWRTRKGHRMADILINSIFVNYMSTEKKYKFIDLALCHKNDSHAFSAYFASEYIHVFDSNFGWVKWKYDTPKDELYSFFNEYFKFNRYDYNEIVICGKYEVNSHIVETKQKLLGQKKEKDLEKEWKIIDELFSDDD